MITLNTIADIYRVLLSVSVKSGVSKPIKGLKALESNDLLNTPMLKTPQDLGSKLQSDRSPLKPKLPFVLKL